VFSRDGSNNRILDIFKEERANLYAFRVKELDTIVYTTSPEHIKKSCNKLNFNIESTYRVTPFIMARINPFTGELISVHSFDGYVDKKREETTTQDDGWCYSDGTWFRKNTG